MNTKTLRTFLIVGILLSNQFSFAQGCIDSLISAGNSQNWTVKSDGSLWGWGWNNFGQLGRVGISPTNRPVSIEALSDWKAISAGDGHSLALRADGTLWACGFNTYGQLGLGNNLVIDSLSQVGTSNTWKSIGTGSGLVSSAIKTDGTLWVWGRNWRGQLGDSSYNDSNVPIQLGTATNWKMVTTGGSHTVAVKTNGTLWAWGLNDNYELGNGTTTRSLIPIQVGTDTDWTWAAAGGGHVLALKNNGTLWAWGLNGQGQVGNGSTTNQATPVQVGSATNWVQIDAEAMHSFGVKSDGTLWAWGDNYLGQLGDSTTQTSRTSPIQVGTDTDWKKVATGRIHTIALKNNGTVWAWGNNGSGELGDSTTTSITVPKQTATSICITTGLLEAKEMSRFEIYPNPSNGQFNIAVDFENNTANRELRILNVYGQLLQSYNLSSQYNNLSADISNFPSGMYFVQVLTGTNVMTLPITKY